MIKTGRIQKADQTPQTRYNDLSHTSEIASNKTVTFGTRKSKDYIDL